MGVPLLFNGTNAVQAAGHVSVTINYRLATLGYLAHPAFATEVGGSEGNYGVLDHVAALTWVKARIGAFGGDPTRVLFYGQSSGANHALWMPVIPAFRGLVSVVAAHSACAQPFFNPDCAMHRNLTSARQSALALAEKHG